MPCLRILTNISINKIPSDFVDKIIPVLSRAVKKEASRFLCVVSGDCQLSFGGDSTSPGVVASLESIGHLGPEENKVITAELTNFIEKEIGVKPARLFISYYDLMGHNIGKGGITLEDLQPTK